MGAVCCSCFCLIVLLSRSPAVHAICLVRHCLGGSYTRNMPMRPMCLLCAASAVFCWVLGAGCSPYAYSERTYYLAVCSTDMSQHVRLGLYGAGVWVTCTADGLISLCASECCWCVTVRVLAAPSALVLGVSCGCLHCTTLAAGHPALLMLCGTYLQITAWLRVGP